MKTLMMLGTWAALASNMSLAADPTRPPLPRVHAPAGMAAPALPALQLQSTLMGGKQPVAIINGQVLRRGDTLEGLRLQAIGSGWARLQTPTGETLTLKLPALAYRPRISANKASAP
ncbi:hypothetical protein [Thermithiobacillus plumbiphilus]|uniref:MSHA biogenesis protein MshK n=1 Tax=Thermithiobacillus plumbiphilus TaxID=1729899 RepID=A0ABU9D8L2_9PROT